MERDDVELINSILAGDEAAFSTLVKNTKRVFTRSRGGKLEISILLKRLRKTLSYKHIKNLPR